MKSRSNFQTEMSLQVSSKHLKNVFFVPYINDMFYQLQCLFSLWLAAQEPAPQENGDTDNVLRKCDIIIITGRAEKCELARTALLVRNLFVRFGFPTVDYGLVSYCCYSSGYTEGPDSCDH